MLNISILTGRMVADPEITVVGANQNRKCSFRIAVPRRFKTESGPDSDFINVVAWNNTADFVGRHFFKGKWINVVGPIQTRTWERDGQKYYGFEINADQVNFVGDKKDNDAKSQPTVQSQSAESAKRQPAHIDDDGVIDENEDLPF